MAGLFEYDLDQTDLVAHDVGDALIRVVDVSTPFTRMVRKGKQLKTVEASWGAYFPNETGDAGRQEGEDKTNFSANKPVTLRSVAQPCRSTGWMVTDIAQYVETGYAKSAAQHIAQQKASDGEGYLLKREKVMLSAQHAVYAGDAQDNISRTTGVFGWLNPTQPDDMWAVPQACRLGAEQWMTQVPTLKAFRDAMLAAGERAAKIGKWTGLVGPKLASAMNDWVLDGTTVSDVLKSIVDEKLKASVSTFQFAEGIVDFIIHFRLLANQDGESTANSAYSGAFLQPDLWRVRHMEPITDKDGTDEGGGPRGWWQDIFMLQCLNPLGQFAVYAEAPANP